MNKTLFKLHSWAALAAFLPLLVICITGSLLVFKYEIDHLLMADKVTVTPSSDRLLLDELRSVINSNHPNYEIVGWMLPQNTKQADKVYVMEKGTAEWSYLLLNPYTGSLLTEPRLHDHYFTDWMLELHYTFLLHDAGLLVTGLFAFVLLMLGVTGIILHRKFWRNFFTLRWKSRLVVYFSDLHKLVGVLSSPILVVVAFTGLWWNVSGFLHEMEEHAEGEEHPVMESRLYSDALSFDQLTTTASQAIAGFEPNYISLPWEPGVNVTVWGDVPTVNFLASPYSSTVTFSPKSGQQISVYDGRQAGVGSKIVDSYGRLHYGDFAGVYSKIVWAIFGAAPLLLSITGLTLWWKRRGARRKKRERRLLQAGGVTSH